MQKKLQRLTNRCSIIVENTFHIEPYVTNETSKTANRKRFDEVGGVSFVFTSKTVDRSHLTQVLGGCSCG
jgi:hypothetical protein